MAIVSLFLPWFFSQYQILSGKVQARSTEGHPQLVLRRSSNAATLLSEPAVGMRRKLCTTVYSPKCAFVKTPGISLNCKLAAVLYREYEYGR